MLAFIAQTIEYRSLDIMLNLYRMLVRPHLEYSVQFWSPYYRKDVTTLEGVQKRFRMLLGLKVLNYKRPDGLGRFSLERRRLRGGLIEVYKIMRGIDKVNSKCLFPMVQEFKSRGHIFKVRGERFKKDLRGNFFTQKVFRMWNELPEEVVDA
eukprot:g34788.t1